MFSPREVTIEEIKWDSEDYVEIKMTNRTVWSGMKRKDFFYPEENWEAKIVVGSKLRLWALQWSRILGVELIDEYGEATSVWCVGNDFETKTQREASNKAYSDFIKREGKRIAGWIDKGKTLAEIDKLIDRGHTGNTYGWALNIGINSAKKKQNAEAIRREHNKKYGVSEEKKGVVNPAVITIGT